MLRMLCRWIHNNVTCDVNKYGFIYWVNKMYIHFIYYVTINRTLFYLQSNTVFLIENNILLTNR